MQQHFFFEGIVIIIFDAIAVVLLCVFWSSFYMLFSLMSNHHFNTKKAFLIKPIVSFFQCRAPCADCGGHFPASLDVSRSLSRRSTLRRSYELGRERRSSRLRLRSYPRSRESYLERRSSLLRLRLLSSRRECE